MVEEHDIEKEIEKLENQFLYVVNEAARILKTVELPEVKQCIAQLRASVKYQHMRCFAGNLTAINRAQSVDAIFSILELYWDFLNCGLLSEIVHKLGNDETKKLMEEYTEKLRVFQKETNLREFLSSRWTRQTPPHFTEFVIEMGGTWGDRTLDGLENLRKELAHSICVKEYALHFKSAHEDQLDSMSVTWVLLNFFPTIALVSSFSLLEAKYDIIKMIFQGKCILTKVPVKLKSQRCPGGGVLVVQDNTLVIKPSIDYKNWNMLVQRSGTELAFSSQNCYLVGYPDLSVVKVITHNAINEKSDAVKLWRRQLYKDVSPTCKCTCKTKCPEPYDDSYLLQLWDDNYHDYFVIEVDHDSEELSYKLGGLECAKTCGAGAFSFN